MAGEFEPIMTADDLQNWAIGENLYLATISTAEQIRNSLKSNLLSGNITPHDLRTTGITVIVDPRLCPNGVPNVWAFNILHRKLGGVVEVSFTGKNPAKEDPWGYEVNVRSFV